MIIGILRFDIFSLTISASATFSSWWYSSTSRLACFPHELVLMPAHSGYPVSFGGVRTELLANSD